MVVLSDFNPEGSILRCQQMQMLEILEYVHNICIEHDIKYWLSSGTLLGAVRHGGFIPWDDDLDIEMLREDYIKLLKVLKKTPSNKYVLQINNTDKDYIAPYAKLRELKSSISEIGNKDQNYMYRGICIDIFPIEKSSPLLLKLAEKVQNRIYYLSSVKNDNLGIKRFVMNILYKFSHYIFYPLLRLVSNLFSDKTYYQTFGTGFYAPRDLNDIFPLKLITFENKEFYSPQDTDKYLSKLYGDYMKLPDLSTIRLHVDEVKLAVSPISQ